MRVTKVWVQHIMVLESIFLTSHVLVNNYPTICILFEKCGDVVSTSTHSVKMS